MGEGWVYHPPAADPPGITSTVVPSADPGNSPSQAVICDSARPERTPASGMAAPVPDRQGASSQLVRILTVVTEAIGGLLNGSSAAAPPLCAL
jgi:hypothetical protein